MDGYWNVLDGLRQVEREKAAREMKSECLPEVCIDLWAKALVECRTRREIMSWAVDKLQKLEANMDGLPVNAEAVRYWLATVRECRHALADNPKLRKGDT